MVFLPQLQNFRAFELEDRESRRYEAGEPYRSLLMIFLNRLKVVSMNRMLLQFLAFLLFLALPVQASNFSCPFGKQGACVDYGDKVCSSRAKCVGNDAICFEPYTCGFGGFVCKSKLDEIVSEYDSLARTCRSIANDHEELIREYNEVAGELDATQRRLYSLSNCVSRATSLDEARWCR